MLASPIQHILMLIYRIANDGIIHGPHGLARGQAKPGEETTLWDARASSASLIPLAPPGCPGCWGRGAFLPPQCRIKSGYCEAESGLHPNVAAVLQNGHRAAPAVKVLSPPAQAKF